MPIENERLRFASCSGVGCDGAGCRWPRPQLTFCSKAASTAEKKTREVPKDLMVLDLMLVDEIQQNILRRGRPLFIL